MLCERWTLLVISRIIDGCTQFNAIHRGVPRISPAMLSKRLRELEHAGLISSTPARRGTPRTYLLTRAGQELAPLIDSLAIWGQHWARDMCFDDLDPGFLAWSMHMSLDTERMPAGRTVLGFEFSGAPRDCRRFWLVNEDGTGLRNLTNHPAQDTSPAWSPDGKKLAFVSTRDGGSDVYVVEVSGASETRR